VISVEEFRAYVDEHLDWARTARTDREREIFLQMARAWLQAAPTRELARRGKAHARDRSVDPKPIAAAIVSVARCTISEPPRHSFSGPRRMHLRCFQFACLFASQS
jgi:hypothetical protein